MIKESFLRNYSLCKIYSEAEDQKRKLKVFYIRHGTPSHMQSRRYSGRNM